MSASSEVAVDESPAAVGQEAENLRLQGNDAFGTGDWNRALQLYRQSVVLSENAETCSNLAATLCKLSKYVEASEAAERATILEPQWAKGWWRRGVAAERLKNFPDASHYYSVAVNIEPKERAFVKSQANAEKRLRVEDGDKNFVAALHARDPNETATKPLSIALKPLGDKNTNCDEEQNAILKKETMRRAQAAREEQVRLAEEDRVKKLRDEFVKQHPPKTDECPICTEVIFVDDLNGFASFQCCGGYTCLGCAEENEICGWTNGKCPFCRARYPTIRTAADEFKLSLRLAEMNKPWEQHSLGVAYYHGYWGLQKNQEQAFKWWRRAADQGYRDSLYELGICYRDGEHVAKCLETARGFFELAACRGHVGAQENLGIFYRDGLGGVRDLAKSNKWLTLAAFSRPYVQYSLAMLYKGPWALQNPVEPSFHLAKYWFEKALEDEEYFLDYVDGMRLKGMIQDELALTMKELGRIA